MGLCKGSKVDGWLQDWREGFKILVPQRGALNPKPD